METSIEGWLSVDEPDEAAQRSAHLSRVRAELRRNHPRLTDKQVDLIAEVAMEVRFARDKFLDRRKRQMESV
jgi:hypothetical protein